MADGCLERQRSHPYRYSIQQLLDLSIAACLPFDLSKFTYDAARAGVIPSLGDCAMSSRKSSAASRARDWSNGTASSDDMIVFQGNQSKQCIRDGHPARMPLRNPVLPPPLEKQKDEGFTRFLKKHSSPTHQRVTAGGRIVPMEPRPSPPVFTRTDKLAALVDTEETEVPKTVVTSNGDHESSRSNVTQIQGTCIDSTALPLAQAETDLISDFAASRPTMHGPGIPFAGTPFDPVRTAGFVPTEKSVYTVHPSIFYHTEGLPYGFGSQYGTPHDGNTYITPLPGRWAFGEHYGYNDSYGTNPYMAQELLSQQCLSAQQSLVYWQQRYDELEQQLRNLDRHRAMRHLDHSMAEQRRVLVQQRSDVKDMIQNIKTVLGASHRAGSSGESFSGGFNVNAPPYIPSSFQGNVPHTANPQKVATSSDVKTVGNEKPQATGVRRPIPIVPPTSTAMETAPVKNVNDASRVHLVSSFVDEWGVQVGQAPPKMKREQSAISETLTKNSSQSPSSNRKSTGSAGDSPPNFAQANDDVNMDGRQIRDCNSKKNEPGVDSSHLPTHVKDAYIKLLDAMRQPKGDITKVQIEGQWMDIEGQGLQLQPSAIMEPWEQDYWAHQSKIEASPGPHNPDVMHSTNSTGQGRFPHQTSSGIICSTNKENHFVLARGHQKAATDAFVAQINAIEENELAASKRGTQSLRENSDMGRIHSTNVLREVCGTNSTEQMNSSSSSKQRVIYTPASSAYAVGASKKVAGDDRFISGPYGDEIHMPSDTIGTKGSSLVAVQNIHAIGHLPHNLDGSMETCRDAGGASNAANRGRSPRLVYRPTANGVAWYGPYCREAIERALGNDKVSTGPKKSFM